MSLVVDASIAVKWVVDEEDRHRARALLLQGGALVAPEFVMVEAANVLATKVSRGQFNAEGARDGLETIRSAFAQLVPDAALAGQALELSLELGHPVYDCVYLACMSAIDGEFVTADVRLLNKLNKAGGWPRVRALST